MRRAPEQRPEGPLVAVETEGAWYVTWHGDRDDWLVEFEKTPAADAARWARNLVGTFNARAASGGHAARLLEHGWTWA